MPLIFKKQFHILSLVALLAGCASPYAIERQAFSDYVLGQHAKYESDIDAAADFYARALRREPENEMILQEAFSLALMDGKYNEALLRARNLMDVNSANSAASMLLSLNAMKQGRYDASLAYLAGARGTGFDSLIAPIIRGWIYATKGDVDASMEALSALETISIFQPFQREQAAMIYDYLGMTEEAEAAYFEVFAQERGVSVHPVMYYGAFLERLGRQAEAWAHYEHYLGIWPGNRRLLEAKERMANSDRATRLVPQPVEMVGLALLRASSEIARDNARAPAILYARLSTFMTPGRGDALILLASLFAAEGQGETGLEALAQIDDDDFFGDIARMREALTLNQMGRTGDAIQVLEKYIEQNENALDAHVSLGDIYQINKQYEDALRHYDAALDIIGTPTVENWYLLFTRGITYERLDRWDEAEADFMKALEMKPGEPQVLNYLGYSWIDRGMNITEARGMIENAVGQRPFDGAIVDSLGWVLFLTGEYEEAVVQLERAVELLPGDPILNDHLGDAYWMVGRRIEARFQWNHALVLEPEDEDRVAIDQKIVLGLDFYQASVTEQ
jgi:tetratricopeptide (TPR) repeat protein